MPRGSENLNLTIPEAVLNQGDQNRGQAGQTSTNDLSHQLYNINISDRGGTPNCTDAPPSYDEAIASSLREARFFPGTSPMRNELNADLHLQNLTLRRTTLESQRTPLNENLTKCTARMEKLATYDSRLDELTKTYNGLNNNRRRLLIRSGQSDRTTSQKLSDKQRSQDYENKIMTDVIPQLHILRDEWANSSGPNHHTGMADAENRQGVVKLIKNLKSVTSSEYSHIDEKVKSLNQHLKELNKKDVQLRTEEQRTIAQLAFR